MGQVIAVYVGRAGARNLEVGLANGIWGFPQAREAYHQIEPGDLLVLGTGYPGSPRVSSDDWKNGSLHTVHVARVTTKAYQDPTPVWPDEGAEVSYPHRFQFTDVRTYTNVSLAADGPLGAGVSEAVRNSAMVQGRGNLQPDSGFRLQPADPTEDAAQPEPPAPQQPEEPITLGHLLDSFEAALGTAGLHFGDDLPSRFLCGLLAKPFTILAGLSGSGKTQLALALGRWLGPGQTHVAAVRPDWTGSEALFGYENLLVPPSSDGRAAWSVPPVLKFLLEAANNPDQPHLLILDEMNLAHVERYFADFLSGMESTWGVLPNLTSQDGVWRLAPGEPERLALPANLIVVGTVNVDETTYQFSPKVLDRATTIEFRVSTDALVADRPDLEAIDVAPPAMLDQITSLLGRQATATVSAEITKQLTDLHADLASHDREFGHRTYQEMLRFASLITEARPHLLDDQVVDFLLLQKILPRLHGSSRELDGVLRMLITTAAGADGSADPLPHSAAKLRRMQAQLQATHFTAF